MVDQSKKPVVSKAMAPAGTHIVTKPNARPALPIDTFKADLNAQYMKTVENYFAGSQEKARLFMTTASVAVQKVPALLECERMSLITALMSCAELNLFPSNVSGEAYIIPYKGKAQFQLGYQGMITLMYRSGVQNIRSNIIFANDDFEYTEGLEPHLSHKPCWRGDKGEVIGVYAVARINGTDIFKVLSIEDVMKFKEFSQSKGSEYSPWNEKNDPERWMLRKTAIKQLAKLLPKNNKLIQAIAEDNEDSIIAKHKLDAGGPAVGKAFHDPAALEPSIQSDNGDMSEDDLKKANDELKRKQEEAAKLAGEEDTIHYPTDDDIAAMEKAERENPD